MLVVLPSVALTDVSGKKFNQDILSFPGHINNEGELIFYDFDNAAKQRRQMQGLCGGVTRPEPMPWIQQRGLNLRI